MQFASIWNWYYEHQDAFNLLTERVGPVSVYGEWLWARHTIEYDELPAFFVPFDIFEHHKDFLATDIVRAALLDCGFSFTPLLYEGKAESYEQIEAWTLEKSHFSSTAIREGVYVKVTDGRYVTHRFKMVRNGFIPGEHWSKKQITKNKLK